MGVKFACHSMDATTPDAPVTEFYDLKIDNYVIQHLLLPVTNNSYVFSAYCNDGGKWVFKWIRPSLGQEFIDREIEMNQRLAGVPNAAVATSFVELFGSWGYFMPRYQGGDVLERLSTGGLLSEDQVREISWPVLVCLSHMHHMGIAHRDIKPENVFLSLESDPLEAFLGDYGLAAPFDENRYFDKPVGTRNYCAPEKVQGYPYDESVDMWAFGVTLYVMLTGNMPFPDSESAFYNAVVNGAYDPIPLRDSGTSEEACDLIKNLLIVSPEDRLTCDGAKDHPFYSSWAQRQVKGHLRVLDSAFDDAESF
jgi:serine/threonine protein kinase